MNQQVTFDRIVNGLNEAMLDDARWPDVSALIDEALRSRGSVLTFGEEGLTSDFEVTFAKCYCRGADRSAWLREYYQNYHMTDELAPRMRALPDARIVRMTELFSEQELKTSRSYNEFYAKVHGQKGLAIRLDGPNGSHIGWGIADPVDASGWSSSQLDLIARIIPHLRQYVRVRSALVDAGAFGRSVAQLLDDVRIGVIQVDSHGRIVEMNDRAREILHRNDGLSAGDGGLRAVSREANDRVRRLLARALPRFGEQGASGSMLVRRPSGLPSFVVHVKPVTHGEVEYRSRRVAALVLIVDPVERTRVDQRLVERLLGLTPAETEVAVLLAQGRTSHQIAAATNRRYTTVRTHLRNVFAKLGISRQVEMVQLLMGLSSLPGSRDQSE